MEPAQSRLQKKRERKRAETQRFEEEKRQERELAAEKGSQAFWKTFEAEEERRKLRASVLPKLFRPKQIEERISAEQLDMSIQIGNRIKKSE